MKKRSFYILASICLSFLMATTSLYAADSPYWDGRYFYDAEGTLFGDGESMVVIDVSQYQKKIDWDAVYESGEVDAVIVRLGYGSATGQEDDYAEYNISELNRLGIPYGVYLYSYAENASEAKAEAKYLVSLMEAFDADPDLPIYYDLERWTIDSTGESSPTSVSTYEKIVTAWVAAMESYGYDNVGVYSYRSYLQTYLNSETILQYVSWVAAYTSTLGFTNDYYTGSLHGWQYTSSATVTGISTRVDMSAFYGYEDGTVDGYVYLSGDINGDGSVSAADYVAIKNYIMGTKTLSSSAKERADVNGDGKVSAADYVAVKNHIMGTKLLF